MKLQSASEALAAAQRLADEADALTGNPGEEFRLLAEAYAAVSAFPADSECSAFAARLEGLVRDAAARANKAAYVPPGKPLVER